MIMIHLYIFYCNIHFTINKKHVAVHTQVYGSAQTNTKQYTDTYQAEHRKIPGSTQNKSGNANTIL